MVPELLEYGQKLHILARIKGTKPTTTPLNVQQTLTTQKGI
jgi:hypothetical protein